MISKNEHVLVVEGTSVELEFITPDLSSCPQIHPNTLSNVTELGRVLLLTLILLIHY